MTPQEAIKILKPLFEHCKGKNECLGYIEHFFTKDEEEALDMATKVSEQQPIDKSAMMYEIYMEGVNMSGEYQGCWVRFKDIEKIVDKYMSESEE